MGGGSYSTDARSLRSHHLGYDTKSANEIFTARTINNAMSPYDIDIRESRDSKEHPESVAIIIALDVTGSMGSIPHFLVKEGLPLIMDKIIKSGIKDPQVLFLGIGDHECDKYPLQVGQFESSDELLDKWLTSVYLEGGGGGNDGESYLLAWYLAAKHTSIDCFEKRKQRGFLFTIGDEPCLREIKKSYLKSIVGERQFDDFTASSLLEEALKSYEVYHIHMKQGHNGRRQEVMDGWAQLIGKPNLIIAKMKEEVADVIPAIIVKAGALTITRAKDVTDVGTGTEPARTGEEVIL
jgi:hypothetical protein